MKAKNHERLSFLLKRCKMFRIKGLFTKSDTSLESPTASSALIKLSLKWRLHSSSKPLPTSFLLCFSFYSFYSLYPSHSSYFPHACPFLLPPFSFFSCPPFPFSFSSFLVWKHNHCSDNLFSYDLQTNDVSSKKHFSPYPVHVDMLRLHYLSSDR